jgi:hypothetical protein
MSVLLTVSIRKDQGCSLSWSSMWASVGIVIRISANKTASQLAITVVGESYRIVEIRTLTWPYLIIPVCHHTGSDRKLGRLSSSVRRLYLVDRGCLLFFLFRLRIKYLFFRINIMDPFRCRSLAFACIMTRISTPSASNIHSGSRNGSSWFPVCAKLTLIASRVSSMLFIILLYSESSVFTFTIAFSLAPLDRCDRRGGDGLR